VSETAAETVAARHQVGFDMARDLDRARRVLGEWLAARLADASSVEVVSLRPPSDNGGSSETYFATVRIAVGGAIRSEDWVVRFNGRDYRLFLRENFDTQYRLLNWLAAETDVPVPAIRFYEPDPAILGSAFWVMERVEGRVPPDNPPYNVGGFVFEASSQDRRRLWRSGLETLARIARLDPARAPTIVTPRAGESGLEENLRHWTESMDWASQGDPPKLLRVANDWLWSHMPSRRETGLSWGDARIGNMVFRDFECVAVLDWETITLAGAQLDLAHWLLMDEYYTTGLGLPPLDGFGGRDETIALWEQLTGRRADQLGWHEVLAGFRLAVNMRRGLTFWPPELAAKLVDPDGESVMSRHLRRVLARVAGI
jgi:aminoglycoside phosphotransferase (APT) family kinase protein